MISNHLLPRRDRSSAGRHRDPLRSRPVQIVLSINSKRVIGRQRHDRRSAPEIHTIHLHLPASSSASYRYVVMVSPGNGRRGRPEGGASECVALPDDGGGSALLPVQLPPLLQRQDSVGCGPCAVDQHALLTGARCSRAGAHRPGLGFGDGSGDERVRQVHPSADAPLPLALPVGLGHPIKVHHIAEAQRAQVQPGVLLLVGVLDADAQLHVVRCPGATIILPFPHDALAWSRGRVVEIALHGTHCSCSERERTHKELIHSKKRIFFVPFHFRKVVHGAKLSNVHLHFYVFGASCFYPKWLTLH